MKTTMRMVGVLVLAACLVVAAACREEDPVPTDAGLGDLGADAAPLDLGVDAGSVDLGNDASAPDLGLADAGSEDAGEVDAGVPDAGAADAGGSDAGPGDARLASLVVGAGASLSPAFTPDTMDYVVALPPGETSVTLTPTAAAPGSATIFVDGVTTPSGSAVMVSANTGFAPRVVDVVVTAGAGAMRTYRVSVVRRSVYVKASNPERDDVFGASIALSADGSTLAVGAPDEDSGGRGIGSDAADNSALYAGAMYVF
jgi:hypothetical protein